ncbi:MAG: DoxX family membrane protein [Pseudomonadota bacterium]
MLTESRLPNHSSILLAARVLFSSLFLLSGITHFTNIDYYVSLTPEVVPFPIFWTIISGVIELLGAMMILFNRRPRLGGWLLVIFLIPVTIVVHGYEMIHAAEAAERLNQQAHFLKGWALIGAALLVTQLGVSGSPVQKKA